MLVALLGFIAAARLLRARWRRVGRDPREGHHHRPLRAAGGHTPAGLRYMRRMGYDMRCFSSDVLALAVAGCVRIHRDKGFLKDDWRLERDGPARWPTLHEPAARCSARLFADGPTLVLKNKNATTVAGARAAHSKALERAAAAALLQAQRRQHR